MASSSGETMPEQQEKLAHQTQDEVHDAPDSQPQGKHPEAGTSTPSVRFSSAVQEISPPVDNAPSQEDQSLGQPGEATPEMLKALSKSLQGGFNNLQERRMNIFSFEPFSLPASRVPSNEDDSRNATREHTRSSGSGRPSPLLGPKNPDLHSPPLTPSGTEYLEGDSKRLSHSHVERATLSPHHDVITPQDSTAHDSSRLSTTKLAHRPASHEEVSKRPDSSDDREHTTQSDHRKGMFSLGPRDSGSLPVSREGSPSRSSAASQYTRPFTPSGDLNDPYAANKRMPQNQNKIEPRFVFNRKKKHSPSSSSTSLGKHSEKRHSALYNKKDELMQHETGSSAFGHHKQGSMADLKRFFKMGGHHKAKRAASPSASVRSGTRTPPSSKSAVQIPFGDDHGLSSKYGKLGKVLGSGAGGSVRLMKRSEDNTIFAVKEFRPRHSYETEKEYVKKLTAEYCMGSSLHHGNIIETLDIVQEKGKWYEVMEYAPYDLFAIVMTGKMSREEVACCFLQILSGVTYLHSMGLAHRDLKLDNVVVSDRGIIKIIDFGSAHVFKYPFESGMVMASGIVGSDPYLAPEVYDERKYDPTAVDIWSLAIIYCCMTLRRFPWKVPRMTDNSFKLFAADPTPGHDPRRLVLPHAKSTNALYDTPGRDTHIHDPSRKGTRADVLKMQDVADNNLHKEGETRDAEKKDDSPEADKRASMDGAGEGDKKHNPATHEKKSDGTLAPPAEKKEVIRGPWRILRLLPRESRHVIGRMLQINPKERIRMPEILEDPWVANTVICRQIGPGVVINADDHTHILEPPSAAK